MLEGGVDIMEITFRTDAAAQAIKEVASVLPDMLAGAGTVINIEQCKQAVNMGAKFIVSPGLDREVVRWCTSHAVTLIPGCATPTDITFALSHGIDTVKFFPANIYGGIAALKALSHPFKNVRFMPTGGINADNMIEYLSLDNVIAIGGSWVSTASDIKNGNFKKITELCVNARQMIERSE